MSLIYFVGSAVAGTIGWATIFATLIWPKLKKQPRTHQLKTLTSIHFFRYFATTMLIAGLVGAKHGAGEPRWRIRRLEAAALGAGAPRRRC